VSEPCRETADAALESAENDTSFNPLDEAVPATCSQLDPELAVHVQPVAVNTPSDAIPPAGGKAVEGDCS
jgi:hypothetical protein